jgi:hypothetical protein
MKLYASPPPGWQSFPQSSWLGAALSGVGLLMRRSLMGRGLMRRGLMRRGLMRRSVDAPQLTALARCEKLLLGRP